MAIARTSRGRNAIVANPGWTVFFRSMSTRELLRYAAEYLDDEASSWEHPALVTALRDRADAETTLEVKRGAAT